MADLKERQRRAVTPTASTVLDIAGKKPAREKYPVNVVFNGADEERIRARAKELDLGVASYIKMLVASDLKNQE